MLQIHIDKRFLPSRNLEPAGIDKKINQNINMESYWSHVDICQHWLMCRENSEKGIQRIWIAFLLFPLFHRILERKMQQELAVPSFWAIWIRLSLWVIKTSWLKFLRRAKVTSVYMLNIWWNMEGWAPSPWSLWIVLHSLFRRSIAVE